MNPTVQHEMRAAGKRMTRARHAVLAALDASRYPVSPAELHARLKKQNVAIDLVTVYRSLAAFKELGLVARLALHQEGLFRYEMKEGRGHHHHIRCRRCGRVVDLPLCPLTRLTAAIERDTRFVVDGHSLELSGRCRACQEAPESAAPRYPDTRSVNG